MPVPESYTENLSAGWEELRPELARLIRALGIGAANVDDVLQEVYLSARQNCPGPMNAEDLRRWLIRVTVNRCNLEHRRTGRWRRFFLKLTQRFDRNHPADESLCRDDQRQQVREALQSLDVRTRSILVLRYFAELDSMEISKILELSDATVRGRLRTARQKLAEKLRQAGYSHE